MVKKQTDIPADVWNAIVAPHEKEIMEKRRQAAAEEKRVKEVQSTVRKAHEIVVLLVADLRAASLKQPDAFVGIPYPNVKFSESTGQTFFHLEFGQWFRILFEVEQKPGLVMARIQRLSRAGTELDPVRKDQLSPTKTEIRDYVLGVAARWRGKMIPEDEVQPSRQPVGQN